MAKLSKNVIVSSDEVLLNHVIVEPPHPTLIEPEINIETLQQEANEKARVLMEQELGQLKKQLEITLASIPQMIAQNRIELNQEIADIVLLITQQFFIENSHDTQRLSQQINQILTQLNNQQSIELCLHPQDIAALQQGAITLDASHLNGLKIKSDESLNLGGYLIKTSHGVFDASIEKQIDKLKEALLQMKSRGSNALLG